MIHIYRASVASSRLSRYFSTTIVRSKSHYDSLGLTPHATQADIKAAYYKMSMEFHPDKNKGSEQAANKFRDITEAYEVLGNLRLRKLYDKGIIHTAGSTFAQETTTKDEETKFYKSREYRSKPVPPSGRTAIYNFDEWTQMHYGASFARREAAKARYARKVEIDDINKTYALLSYIFFGILFVASFFGNFSYDVVEKKDDKTPNSSKHLSQAE